VSLVVQVERGFADLLPELVVGVAAAVRILPGATLEDQPATRLFNST
jgi:hypothetical protein